MGFVDLYRMIMGWWSSPADQGPLGEGHLTVYATAQGVLDIAPSGIDGPTLTVYPTTAGILEVPG